MSETLTDFSNATEEELRDLSQQEISDSNIIVDQNVKKDEDHLDHPVTTGNTDAKYKVPLAFNSVQFLPYHTFQVISEDKQPWIRHIEVLSDGTLLLADRYNKQLLLYDRHYFFLKSAKFSSGPWSLAITNNNSAAVTLPDQKEIVFIATDRMKSTHKINVHDDCRGIACIDNKLIVNCVTNGIKVLTMTGKTLKVFPQYLGYISLLRGANERLLCSLFAEDRVVCMDLKGKVKYEFTDKTLRGPCSLTADRVQDCLYVVSHHGNNIHMFGDRGGKSRIILTKADGIDRPWAIAYDSNSGKLFISTFGGKNICVLDKVEDD